MSYSGPVAGGPLHGASLRAELPVVVSSVDGRTGTALAVAVNHLRSREHLRCGEYWWHPLVRMWVWRGPNTAEV